MEDINKRLRDATDACLACHAEWVKNVKNSTAREKLMEAVHELRKIAARLEIDIAVSERDEMASKPLPIPPHRSSNKRGQGQDEDDNAGNLNEEAHEPRSGGGGGADLSRNMRRSRRPGGGGGHGGGHGGGNGQPAEG